MLLIILSIVSWTGKSHGSVSPNTAFATHIPLAVSLWASLSVQRTFVDVSAFAYFVNNAEREPLKLAVPQKYPSVCFVNFLLVSPPSRPTSHGQQVCLEVALLH